MTQVIIKQVKNMAVSKFFLIISLIISIVNSQSKNKVCNSVYNPVLYDKRIFEINIWPLLRLKRKWFLFVGLVS